MLKVYYSLKEFSVIAYSEFSVVVYKEFSVIAYKEFSVIARCLVRCVLIII